MTKYIRDKKLLPEPEIDHIWNTTIERVIEFQEGYAQAKAEGKEAEFVASHAAQDYRGEVLVNNNNIGETVWQENHDGSKSHAKCTANPTLETPRTLPGSPCQGR